VKEEFGWFFFGVLGDELWEDVFLLLEYKVLFQSWWWYYDFSFVFIFLSLQIDVVSFCNIEHCSSLSFILFLCKWSLDSTIINKEGNIGGVWEFPM
jgi:hypothetical protein